MISLSQMNNAMVFNDGIRCDDGLWKFTGYIYSKYTLSKHLSNLFDYKHIEYLPPFFNAGHLGTAKACEWHRERSC